MKRTNLIIIALINCALLMGQNRDNGFLLAGSVIYEQTDQLNIQLEGDAAQFADALPRERTTEKILHFTDEASLYENHHTDNPEEIGEMHSGGGMMIKMSEPDNKVYTDLKTGQQTEQKEFMSRIFLIESERPDRDWKITGNQKMILDYPCQEAISGDDETEVVVWFTPAIAVPTGPEELGNLPGLVLEVNKDNGEHVLKAISVELKEPEKGLLKKPVKGKEVTEEEFQAIVAEKMKEMGMEEGSSGGDRTFVIRIEAN